MESWQERPVYIAVLAFLAGAAVTAIIMFFILGGDGDDSSATAATPTPFNTPVPLATQPGIDIQTSTPGATATAGPTDTPEPDAGPTDPDEALAAFVQAEFNEEFIGECPTEAAPGETTAGICGSELHRGEDLLTVTLGVPFSEGIGEAVVTRNEDGTWSVAFVPAPPLGGDGIAVGGEAVVYAAGTCLNFRAEPSASAEVQSCSIDGTRAVVVDGPVEAGGITWWQLEGLGWASAEFLAPVS